MADCRRLFFTAKRRKKRFHRGFLVRIFENDDNIKTA